MIQAAASRLRIWSAVNLRGGRGIVRHGHHGRPWFHHSFRQDTYLRNGSKRYLQADLKSSSLSDEKRFAADFVGDGKSFFARIDLFNLA
jgi:hypothetical protein